MGGVQSCEQKTISDVAHPLWPQRPYQRTELSDARLSARPPQRAVSRQLTGALRPCGAA
jgi:hypothetical protein